MINIVLLVHYLHTFLYQHAAVLPIECHAQHGGYISFLHKTFFLKMLQHVFLSQFSIVDVPHKFWNLPTQQDKVR